MSTKLKKGSLHICEEPYSVEEIRVALKEIQNTLKDDDVLRKRRFRCENYFKTINHVDLYKIGSFYHEIINQKKKTFAFYGINLGSKVKDTIIGLASFFNYHHEIKITIIVDEYDHDWMESIPCKDLIHRQCQKDISYRVLIADGIEVVELKHIRELAIKNGLDYDVVIDKVVDDAEIVFWELPKVSKMEEEREVYFPLWLNLDGVSIVVNKGETKSSQLKPFLDFCKKSDKNIFGVLFTEH